MSKKTRVDYQKLAEGLRQHLHSGETKAGEVCKHLNISQSTFSRVVSRIERELLVTGRAGKTQYALKRSVLDVGHSVSMYELDSQGKARKLGILHAVQPDGFYFEGEEAFDRHSRFFDGLPYFADDLRPSGFLGRSVPKRHADLGLPNSIDDWTADHCLKYLTRYGSDLIGSLILGDEAFQRYLRNSRGESKIIEASDRARAYPAMAIDVLKSGDPGSSAGGEQPKFSAVLQPKSIPVLVKFSPAGHDEVSRRLADLVVSEHLCLGVLNGCGKSAAESDLVLSSGQAFLEVRRFDRVGGRGRRGLVSLRVLDAEFVGKGRTWTESAKELYAQKRITKGTYDEVRWREMFGHMIGNTDMHQANISFYFEFPEVLGPAPVYDMLPMLYAPQNGQIVAREFDPPMPGPDDSDIWGEVWNAGRLFWESVSRDSRISTSFRNIARKNLKKVRSLEHVKDMLPE